MYIPGTQPPTYIMPAYKPTQLSIYISDRHTNIPMDGYKQHGDDAVRVWWHHGTEGLSFASRDWIEMPVFHYLTLLVHQGKQLEFFKLLKCLKGNIADRRCSKYTWVINNVIGATYIRGFTVSLSREPSSLPSWQSVDCIWWRESINQVIMVSALTI